MRTGLFNSGRAQRNADPEREDLADRLAHRRAIGSEAAASTSPVHRPA